MTQAIGARTAPAITVATLCWLVLGVGFAALRLGVALLAPVGGPELDGLAGAWQLSNGHLDDRFIPTLASAVTAFTLLFTTSELSARLAAVVVSATVPFALWLLRGRLGEAALLAAVVFIGLDAATVFLGGTASAYAFDLAAVAWAAVVLDRWRDRPLAWAAVALAASLSGPLLLTFLVAAALGARLPRGRHGLTPLRGRATGAALGLLLGVLVASLRFGGGWDGLAIPPLLLFAEGFDRRWSASPGGDLVLLYAVPLLLPALAWAGYLAGQWLRGRPPAWQERFLLAWLGVTGAWLLATFGHGSQAALAAVALPASLLLGRALVPALRALSTADWYYPRLVLPAIALLAGLALVQALDWADEGRMGSASEQARVFLFGSAAVLLVVLLAMNRRTVPVLLLPALLVALPLHGAGGFGVALKGGDEPLLSPLSTQQARDLRGVSLDFVAGQGGVIAVHPRLIDAITWPFRDSGDLTVSASVPADATVVLWPLDLAAPAGFEVLEGDWALTTETVAPLEDGLTYLNWLSDRSTLRTMPAQIAVYTKAAE